MDLVAAVGAASATVRRSARTALDAATTLLGGVVLPILGAVGFCTRVPLGTGERAWTAMTARPWAMVVAAYPLGGALALALVPAIPPATTAVLFPVWLLLLAGITHLDGLADVGDAAVVHGDVERRRDVLLDTEVGVGALVAVGVALVGVALAAYELALVGHGAAATARGLPTAADAARPLAAADAYRPLTAAAGVVIAAEVGAKLGMVTLAGLGPQLFGTLGSQLDRADGGTALAAAVLAVPAAVAPALLVHRAAGVAATGALLAGPLAALLVGAWANARLDGVNGDCFGATNEIARLCGLHVGLALLASPLALTALP